jgi:hypothetical protein
MTALTVKVALPNELFDPQPIFDQRFPAPLAHQERYARAATYGPDNQRDTRIPDAPSQGRRIGEGQHIARGNRASASSNRSGSRAVANVIKPQARVTFAASTSNHARSA